MVMHNIRPRLPTHKSDGIFSVAIQCAVISAPDEMRQCVCGNRDTGEVSGERTQLGRQIARRVVMKSQHRGAARASELITRASEARELARASFLAALI